MVYLTKIDIQERRKYSIIYEICLLLSLIISIICCSIKYWIKTETELNNSNNNVHEKNIIYTGLFLENNNEFLCVEDMSVSDCGKLNASKSSAIISLLFGFLALLLTIKYIHFDNFNNMNGNNDKKCINNNGYITSLGATYIIMLTSCQVIFNIICVVYYSYLKKSYFESDDFNAEYENNSKSEYSAGFILMCLDTAFSAVFVYCLYYYFVHAHNDFNKNTVKGYTILEQSNTRNY